MDATNLRSEAQIGARVRRDQNSEPQPGRLPDGTFECPACGSKVQPLVASSTPLRVVRLLPRPPHRQRSLPKGGSGLRRLTRGFRVVSDRR